MTRSVGLEGGPQEIDVHTQRGLRVVYGGLLLILAHEISDVKSYLNTKPLLVKRPRINSL